MYKTKCPPFSLDGVRGSQATKSLAYFVAKHPKRYDVYCIPGRFWVDSLSRKSAREARNVCEQAEEMIDWEAVGSGSLIDMQRVCAKAGFDTPKGLYDAFRRLTPDYLPPRTDTVLGVFENRVDWVDPEHLYGVLCTPFGKYAVVYWDDQAKPRPVWRVNGHMTHETDLATWNNIAAFSGQYGKRLNNTLVEAMTAATALYDQYKERKRREECLKDIMSDEWICQKLGSRFDD